MLSFSIHEGNYRVTETIMSFTTTTVKTVDYKTDLSQHRVNNNPWQTTDQPTKDWFNKYHRRHFDSLKIETRGAE